MCRVSLRRGCRHPQGRASPGAGTAVHIAARDRCGRSSPVATSRCLWLPRCLTEWCNHWASRLVRTVGGVWQLGVVVNDSKWQKYALVGGPIFVVLAIVGTALAGS